MATVRITAEAAKEFEKLPAKIQDRVSIVLVRLEKWPMVSGSKPLRGKLAGHCRIRTGDYRIQFYIVGDVVTVEKIGHRDGFYDD